MCYMKSCDYQIPADYNPTICSENCKTEDVIRVHNNCLTIFKKTGLHVKNGELRGYSRLNFIMRIVVAIQNWHTNGRLKQEAAEEITKTFNYILNINTNYELSAITLHLPDLENRLHDTYLEYDGYPRLCTDFDSMYTIPYTALAKKIIRKYPKEKYPELYNYAHRIIHERPMRVKIKVGVKYPDGRTIQEERKVDNVRSLVGNTQPFKTTTVWRCHYENG